MSTWSFDDLIISGDFILGATRTAIYLLLSMDEYILSVLKFAPTYITLMYGMVIIMSYSWLDHIQTLHPDLISFDDVADHLPLL